MYLRGLGSTISVLDKNGIIKSFSSITPELDASLKIRLNVTNETGHTYTVTEFMGGWLLDGCPLNVVLGQGWIAGQKEALAGAGIFPSCPENRTTPAIQTVPSAPSFAPPTQQAAPSFAPTPMPAGARILPTGVATPSSPQQIVSPSYVSIPGYGEMEPEAQPEESSNLLPIALIGLAAIVFMSRRR